MANKNDDDVAISVSNLHKTFRIPLENGNSLKQKIVNFATNKKGYREFSPLNGIDFKIKKGEFFGIVGRNGSGKSTLLKTIAGIYTPERGKITVNGTLVPFIELGVGFNPELTGRENVFLNGALLGFGRAEMESMYDEIVDFAELHDFMDERLKNYSSGMQVRLAFSIAIRAEGDILLLDEVLAVGDEAFQRKCYDYFAKLKKAKKTVILVTHSMESMQRFCTRAILISDGSLVLEGSASDVAKAYQKLNSIETSDSSGDSELADTRRGEVSGVSSVSIDNLGSNIRQVSGDYKNITISTSIKLEQNVDDAFFGFTIRKMTGELVFWYTTEDNDDFNGAFDADRANRFSLTIQNIFGEGQYVIGISVKSKDRSKEYFIEDEALVFSVVDRGTNGWMLHPEYSWSIDRE